MRPRDGKGKTQPASQSMSSDLLSLREKHNQFRAYLVFRKCFEGKDDIGAVQSSLMVLDDLMKDIIKAHQDSNVDLFNAKKKEYEQKLAKHQIHADTSSEITSKSISAVVRKQQSGGESIDALLLDAKANLQANIVSAYLIKIYNQLDDEQKPFFAEAILEKFKAGELAPLMTSPSARLKSDKMKAEYLDDLSEHTDAAIKALPKAGELKSKSDSIKLKIKKSAIEEAAVVDSDESEKKSKPKDENIKQRAGSETDQFLQKYKISDQQFDQSAKRLVGSRIDDHVADIKKAKKEEAVATADEGMLYLQTCLKNYNDYAAQAQKHPDQLQHLDSKQEIHLRMCQLLQDNFKKKLKKSDRLDPQAKAIAYALLSEMEGKNGKLQPQEHELVKTISQFKGEMEQDKKMAELCKKVVLTPEEIKRAAMQRRKSEGAMARAKTLVRSISKTVMPKRTVTAPGRLTPRQEQKEAEQKKSEEMEQIERPKMKK